MIESIITYTFLAFILLIPPAMILSLVYIGIKKYQSNRKLQKFKKAIGAGPVTENSKLSGQLYEILETTLFATRTGEHSLKDVSTGIFNHKKYWIARYHYKGPVIMQKDLQRGADYLLLVVEASVLLNEFWLYHRQNGVLASVAESFAKEQLIALTDPDWSWALASSQNVPDILRASRINGITLRNITKPGDSIFLFNNLIIIASRDDLNLKWFDTVKEKLSVITSIT